MEKLITLNGKIYIQGKGLVNYNGSEPTSDQRRRFYNFLQHNGKINKNCKFGKEHTYKIEKYDSEKKESKIETIVKKIIDANLLRKTILGSENDVIPNIISNNPSLKLKYLSQLGMIARGWMFTLDKSKNSTDVMLNNGKNSKKEADENNDDSTETKERGVVIKRKSGITITDAEQICGAVTEMKVCSKEGERDSNSLFYNETCGDIRYMSEVYFDIKQLQFISIDDNFDRMSIFERESEDYINNLKSNGYIAQKGLFKTVEDNLIGEQGILLPENCVYDQIRLAIDKILKIKISRANAYAKIEKFVLEIDGKEVEIKTIQDFDNLNLKFGCNFQNMN